MAHHIPRTILATLAATALLAVSAGATASASSPSSAWPTVRRAGVQVHGRYVPLVGDFDGDGLDDVFWYAPGPAQDWMWLGRQGGGFTKVAHSPQVRGLYRPVVGRFAGDGADDILWYAPGRAPDSLWVMHHGRPTASIAMQVSGDYRPVVLANAGAFDSICWCGERDLNSVWRFRASGHVAFHLGNELYVDVPVTDGSQAPVVGDFDGDGWADLTTQSFDDVHRFVDVIWLGPNGAEGTSTVGTYGDTDPIVAADLDGNSRTDLVVSTGVEHHGPSGTAIVELGQSDRTFDQVTGGSQSGMAYRVRRPGQGDGVLLLDGTSGVVANAGLLTLTDGAVQISPESITGTGVGRVLVGAFSGGANDDLFAVSPADVRGAADGTDAEHIAPPRA